MKINELSADEFMQGAALVAEGVGGIAGGETGKAILADIRENAGGKSEEDALEWAVNMLSSFLPRLLKENGEDVYRVLAGVDGQTLDEYKAAFTPVKLARDVKAFTAALQEDGELRELLGSFFS